ncbi:MAG: CRTAC1 family protein [Chitinophagales bacterium]
MGIAVGDIDNDNHLDYYFTNIGKNVLLRNKGDNTFENIAAAAGVENEWVKRDSTCQTSWGCNFLDYDNDGFQDLFVACGWSNITFPNTDSKEKNKLYKNDGNGLTFTDVSETAGIDSPLSNKGSAIIDYNNDGKMDLVALTTKMQYPAPVADSLQHSFLFENNDDNDNHWIKIKLEGATCNRDGFGSRIVVYAGGHTYCREVEGGGSHASQNSSYNHFGIGDAAVIDSIKIYWLRGKIQPLKQVAVNQTITIHENASYPTAVSSHSAAIYGLSVFPTIVRDLHELSIVLPVAKGGSYSFLITDVYGKSKEMGKINPGNDIIIHPEIYSSSPAMTSGCYMITIYDEKGYSYTGKFILLSN